MLQDEISSAQRDNEVSFFPAQSNHRPGIQLDVDFFHRQILYPSGKFFNLSVKGASLPKLQKLGPKLWVPYVMPLMPVCQIRRHQLPAFTNGHAGGYFTENMYAAFECFNRVGSVKTHRCTHEQRINMVAKRKCVYAIRDSSES